MLLFLCVFVTVCVYVFVTVCVCVQEILSTFAELKPLLKKSRSGLTASLVGGGEGDPALRGDPQGVNAAEQQDTNILSRIQRLYNLTAEAKVSAHSLAGACTVQASQGPFRSLEIEFSIKGLCIIFNSIILF